LSPGKLNIIRHDGGFTAVLDNQTGNKGLLIIIFGLLFILSVLAFYFGLSSEAGSNLLKFIAMIIFTSLLNFYKIAMLSAEKESMEVKNGKVVLNYFVGGIKFSNTIKLKNIRDISHKRGSDFFDYLNNDNRFFDATVNKMGIKTRFLTYYWGRKIDFAQVVKVENIFRKLRGV
jgi:hypothetical protein